MSPVEGDSAAGTVGTLLMSRDPALPNHPVQPAEPNPGHSAPWPRWKTLLGVGTATKPQPSPAQVGLGALRTFHTPQTPWGFAPSSQRGEQAALGEPDPHRAAPAGESTCGVTAAAKGFSSFPWKNFGFAVML